MSPTSQNTPYNEVDANVDVVVASMRPLAHVYHIPHPLINKKKNKMRVHIQWDHFSEEDCFLENIFLYTFSFLKCMKFTKEVIVPMNQCLILYFEESITHIL